MKLKNKDGVEEEKLHKVIYLIHDVTGDVITSQCKAWNDTVHLAMLIDLILKTSCSKVSRQIVSLDG